MSRISVEVFKTNVREMYQAHALLDLLQQYFPGSRINFDLEDCDNILRVEGNNISSQKVIQLLHKNNCYCEVLE
mgnify:CR=1 FL=1